MPGGHALTSRPHGRALLAALDGLRRRIDAVVTWDAVCLLPRRQAHPGTAPGWLAAWHTALLLADTGIMISSTQEDDLILGILLGAGGSLDRRQAAPRSFTRHAALRRAGPPPSCLAVCQHHPSAPDEPVPGLPRAGRFR
jgi:hypothetical protein